MGSLQNPEGILCRKGLVKKAAASGMVGDEGRADTWRTEQEGDKGDSKLRRRGPEA